MVDRELALRVLWQELKACNRENDIETAESIELQLLVLLLACQNVISVVSQRDHNQ